MKRFITTLVQASTLSLLMASVAHASTSSNSTPDPGNTLAQADVVSDETLGEMRGRFVDGNAILYFGIEMVSYLKTPNGTLESGVGFSANFQNPGQPNIQYRPFTSNTESGTLSSNPNQTITGNGLVNVNGVLQSVQSAGSNNTANNNLTVNIEGINDPTPTFSSTFTNVPNQTLGTSSTSTSADGAVSEVNSSNSELMTSVYIPGQGQVLQYLKQNNYVTGSGLGQQIALTSNNNIAQNFINLQIQMNTQQVLSHAGEQASQLLTKFGKL